MYRLFLFWQHRAFLLFALAVASFCIGCGAADNPTQAEINANKASSEKFLASLKDKDFDSAYKMTFADEMQASGEKPPFSTKEIEFLVKSAESFIGPTETWQWQYEGKGLSRDHRGQFITYGYKMTGGIGNGFMHIQFKQEGNKWEIFYFQFEQKK